MKKRNEIFIFLGIFSICLPNAVHAYAGPGAALGVIIVFITVIIAFFASFFISIFQFLKKTFVSFKNYLLTKKKLSKKKNLSNINDD